MPGIPPAAPRSPVFAGQAYGERLATNVPERVSQPRFGWLGVFAGALILVGAMLPWVRIDTLHVVRTGNGYGPLTSLIGVLVAASALLVVLRRGQGWVSITTLTAGTVTSVLSLLELDSLAADTAAEFRVPIAAATEGPGLLMVSVGSLLAVISGTCALCRRTARAARDWC